MKYARSYAAAAVDNGKFIVCGGLYGNSLTSVECFDPESGIWTELNDMPTPLHYHSLVSYGNNLILMGGHDGKTQIHTVLELSNLEGKGTWKELPPMKQPRDSFSATVLDHGIFVIGGSNGIGKDLDKTEIFNGKSWREGPQLPNLCRGMPSIVIPRHLADILSYYTG